MKNVFRTILSRLLLLIFLLCAPVHLEATQINKEGTVTKKPWQEHLMKIEVDGTSYTLMPKTDIRLQYKTKRDSYNEKSIGLNQIRKGQNIIMRIQGNRIYQITILAN